VYVFLLSVRPIAHCPLAYFEEQEKALEFIRESPDLKIDEKKRFFKAANTNLGLLSCLGVFRSTNPIILGITALCLSGGASFGYCTSTHYTLAVSMELRVDHCGVVKALLDEALLPRVITGTSAGGLIAALCCTRKGIGVCNIARLRF
jgi:predicted acylesterase/phospholipase RssA